MISKKRVVVTGIGVTSALGYETDVFFENLVNGCSAINTIETMKYESIRRRNAAQIKLPIPIPTKWNNYCRAVQIALFAAEKAIIDAKIEIESNEYNIGICFGTTLGAIPEIQKQYCEVGADKLSKIDEQVLLQFSYNTIMDTMAYEFHIKGMRNTLGLACASSTASIGHAFKWIKNGRLDAVLCGGADIFSLISHLIMSSMRLIALDVPKPFDVNRSGFVLGEGAGMLILESEESAIRRQANIYCEVLGYGESCDAEDLNHSDKEGNGLSLAMEKAIIESELNKTEIGYINAHGVGTKSTDAMELKAIQNVFGSHAKSLYLSSIKGAIGHASGACGVLDVIATVLTLINDKIPPTLNFRFNERMKDFNIVSEKCIQTNLKGVMSNSIAFGGINSSIILGKYNYE